MTNNYRRGYNFERAVTRHLTEYLEKNCPEIKFKITESRGSRGACDQHVGLTLHSGQRWFGIQCKKIKPSPRSMHKKIREALKKHGMPLFFAWKEKRTILFYPDLNEYLEEDSDV